MINVLISLAVLSLLWVIYRMVSWVNSKFEIHFQNQKKIIELLETSTPSSDFKIGDVVVNIATNKIMWIQEVVDNKFKCCWKEGEQLVYGVFPSINIKRYNGEA